MIKKYVKQLLRRVSPAFDRRVRRFEATYAEYEKKKTRIRTEKELELQARGLKEVRDILNTLEIPYYLSGGTLLGVIREGDFIKWDWDVGIDARLEDIYPKEKLLITTLKEAGFQMEVCDSRKSDFKVNALKYGARYEIVALMKIGSSRYRRAYNYSASLVEGQSEVTLRGEKYTTFTYPEKYLERIYGDWKTPVRTATKKKYVTVASRTSKLSRIMIKIVGLFTQ